MKHLFLSALICFSVSGCSSVDSARFNRSPASASTREELVLKHLLESDNPRLEAARLVDRLLTIRLRAQDYLQRFDRELAGRKEGEEIFILPSYRRLLAARPLAEAMEEKIVALYSEARNTALRISSSPEERDLDARAQLVVAGMRDALLEVRKSPAKRVLLQDLMEGLKGTIGHLEAEASLRAMVEPLQASLVGKVAESSSEELKRLVRELPDSDDVKEEIEGGARELPGAEAGAGERAPSAATHYPSTGPAGNMMGNNFPAGTFALTYDDGPHASLTMANLRVLEEQEVKATFFWIANNVLRYPSIVKQVKAAGMPLANHSYMHAKILSSRDLRRLRTSPEKEIYTSTDELTRVYGFKPRFFRLPYAQGFDNDRIRGMIAERGMIHVKWNIDSVDWQDKNPSTVLARVEAQMRQTGRGIILFHDVQEPTVQASRSLMRRQKGKVRWVTIPQIVDELNGRR